MKLSAQLRATHNQDGAVVLDILHGRMFQLNLVGSRMLEFLRQGASESQIVEEISRLFRVPQETVATDFREFVAHLETHHLLEIAQPSDVPSER